MTFVDLESIKLKYNPKSEEKFFGFSIAFMRYFPLLLESNRTQVIMEKSSLKTIEQDTYGTLMTK